MLEHKPVCVHRTVSNYDVMLFLFLELEFIELGTYTYI